MRKWLLPCISVGADSLGERLTFICLVHGIHGTIDALEDEGEAMIGPFFSINESNIGHAAMRAASRPIPQDAPAEMKLGLRTEDSGHEEAYIEISTPRGFSRGIRIGKADVVAILEIQDNENCRAACQRYIDDLAQQARQAVLDAQAHSELRKDFDLDTGSEPYVGARGLILMA